MKRFISFLFLFICINSFSSSANETAEPSLVSVNQSGKKSKWTYRTAPDGFKWLPFEDEFGYLGVKDKNGKILIPSLYIRVDYKDGFFIVTDRFSIISIYLKTGELFLPAHDDVHINFDTNIQNSPFIIASKRGTWRAMSRKGKIIVAEDCYKAILLSQTDNGSVVNDWVLKVYKDSYSCIVDSTGKVIIPLNKYNEIYRYWNKGVGITYPFEIYGDSAKSGICNSDGAEYIRSPFKMIWVDEDSKGAPCLKARWGGNVIEADLNGKARQELASLTPLNALYEIELNGIKYTKILTPQGKYGVEKDGKMIIPAAYDLIMTTGNYFKVKKGLYSGIYDIYGNIIVSPDKYNDIIFMDSIKIDDFTYIVPNFYAAINQKSTALNLKGQEYLPIEDGQPYPYKSANESFLLVLGNENHKFAIFRGNTRLTDYKYTDVAFMIDKDIKKCAVFCVSDDSKKFGLCRLDGEEIVKPMYTNISLVKNDGKMYYKVYNGNMIGLYDQEGRLLVTPELFSEISFSGKKIIATGYDRRCEFNFKGKLLLDSHPNTERDNYIKMADKEFEEEDWGSAAKYYGKAIEYWESASLYFNRAISYYNDSKYNKAIDDFNRCLSLKPSQNLIDRSRSLIVKARDLQAEKIARREAFWGNVVGLVLGAAATYVQVKYSTQNGSSSSYAANSYKRDKSLDYLLDPNYTMQQVQLENWREYMAMTDGGRTMSYEQWYALKAQSMSNSNSGESSGGHSSGSSSSSNNSYSKDCRLCYGSGDCRTCEGRGYYFNSLNLSQRLPCPNCYQHNGKCSSCGGTGKK